MQFVSVLVADETVRTSLCRNDMDSLEQHTFDKSTDTNDQGVFRLNATFSATHKEPYSPERSVKSDGSLVATTTLLCFGKVPSCFAPGNLLLNSKTTVNHDRGYVMANERNAALWSE